MHWLFGIMLLLLLLARVVAIAMRALGQPPLWGPESMIGTFAWARTDIVPEGQVEAMGVRWQAQTRGPSIAKGSRVRISSTSGLMLIVEAAEATGGFPGRP